MPESGQRISEYLLDARIGTGAFGEVWRARHHVWSDQVVAIKIPNDPTYIRDLQREGLAVQGLEHPNIAKARGFDPYADPPYLVIEYVPGDSLRGLIRSRQLTIDEAVSVMRQILEGLSYAHIAKIVHRDLKPENVLIHESAKQKGLSEPGVVKITDFGFGQRASSASAQSIAYSMSLEPDKAQRIVGTIAYMSPEQRDGQTVDARTDLYACGVILFEMLTGEKPTGTEVPSDLRTGVPPHLDETYRRACARLEKRFSTAEQMSQQLLPTPLMIDPLARMGQSLGPPPLHRRPSGLVPCPRCQRPTGSKDQFCMHCGVQLTPTVRRCSHCGGYPDADDDFCTHCGRTLNTMRIA